MSLLNSLQVGMLQEKQAESMEGLGKGNLDRMRRTDLKTFKED